MDYWLKCLFKWKFNRKNILSSLTYEYYFFEGIGNYNMNIIFLKEVEIIKMKLLKNILMFISLMENVKK